MFFKYNLWKYTDISNALGHQQIAYLRSGVNSDCVDYRFKAGQLSLITG